jgi:hypothetical protein
VKTVALRDLVSSDRYGIKMDIEGAEYQLEESAAVFSNATWIVGELHFGSFSRPEHRWMLELLTSRFDTTFALPKVAYERDTFVAAMTFSAGRRK